MHTKFIKFLGLKIYEKNLGRFGCSYKFFEKFICYKEKSTNMYSRKSLKIFGTHIFDKIVNYGLIQYKFLGILKKNVNIKNKFRKFIKTLKNDDIYYLYSNGGEAFVFFAYCAKNFLKKNKSNKPLFIATQKFQIDLVKMYLPDAEYLYCPDFYFLGEDQNILKIGKHRVFLIFSHGHFVPYEQDLQNPELETEHFMKRIIKTLKMDKKEISKPEVFISENYKKMFENKINKINLDLNNFVIIAPETKTSSPLPISLWEKIITEFKKRNVEIFCNTKDNEFLFEGCKSLKLNYIEAFLLAQKAKALICIKSGFPEILVPANCPTIAVYRKYRNIKKYKLSADKIISAFSMHKLPYVNNELICELNYDNYKTDDDLFENIMLNYDKMVNRN